MAKINKKAQEILDMLASDDEFPSKFVEKFDQNHITPLGTVPVL